MLYSKAGHFLEDTDDMHVEQTWRWSTLKESLTTLSLFHPFLLSFRAVPTFDTIIMPFGDELAVCCGFTTAFAMKTAF